MSRLLTDVADLAGYAEPVTAPKELDTGLVRYADLLRHVWLMFSTKYMCYIRSFGCMILYRKCVDSLKRSVRICLFIHSVRLFFNSCFS